jgi:hypothetical protein
MDWGIILDSAGPGVHLVHMVVEVRPTPESRAEVPEEETFEVSGRLVWDETVVDLCGVQDRRYYDPRWGPGNDEEDPAQWEGFMWIGDIFYTDEWCTWSWSKSELQSAFDDFGMPEQACVDFTADDLTYELCEPLYELPATYNWNWTD